MATAKKNFLVFGVSDRLNVVREALRAAEEAYYRSTINVPINYGTVVQDAAGQQDELWKRVEELQAEYKAVESEASDNG